MENRRVPQRISSSKDLSSRKIHLAKIHPNSKPINSYNTRIRRKITPNTTPSLPRISTPTPGPARTSTSHSTVAQLTNQMGLDSQKRTRICPRLAIGLRWSKLNPQLKSLKLKAILICQIKLV